MTERCSAELVAEALGIWIYLPYPIECTEFEDIEDYKCLDIVFSTLMVFCDAFGDEMLESCENFLQQMSISKESFIDFLKPRALLLAEKNGYFDFMMVCMYFTVALNCRLSPHNCFHLARVTCKLLNRILEDKFGEIFETDAGWENLMSYCRNLHAAVYPSIKNRPSGFVPSFKKSLAKWRARNAIKDDKVEESVESKDKNMVSLENNTENKEILPIELLGVAQGEDSHHLSSIKDDSSTDSDSIPDDTTYWKYIYMNPNIIREKITHSEAHLKDVNNVLKKLKHHMDVDCNLSNDFEVSFSDEEYIEQLDKEDKKSETDYPDRLKKICANRICAEQNAKSGATSCEDKVCPEDITDDQIREFIRKEFHDDPKCALCEGKLESFRKHWKKSFHDKYPNWSTFSIVPLNC